MWFFLQQKFYVKKYHSFTHSYVESLTYADMQQQSGNLLLLQQEPSGTIARQRSYFKMFTLFTWPIIFVAVQPQRMAWQCSVLLLCIFVLLYHNLFQDVQKYCLIFVLCFVFQNIEKFFVFQSPLQGDVQSKNVFDIK